MKLLSFLTTFGVDFVCNFALVCSNRVGQQKHPFPNESKKRHKPMIKAKIGNYIYTGFIVIAMTILVQQALHKISPKCRLLLKVSTDQIKQFEAKLSSSCKE
jgi:hypothetical protein